MEAITQGNKSTKAVKESGKEKNDAKKKIPIPTVLGSCRPNNGIKAGTSCVISRTSRIHGDLAIIAAINHVPKCPCTYEITN